MIFIFLLKIIVVCLIVLAIVIPVVLYFKNKEKTTTTTTTTTSTTKTPTTITPLIKSIASVITTTLSPLVPSQVITSTLPPQIITTTTTLPPTTTTLQPAITTTTIPPLNIYTTTMSIWLDATISSNWNGTTWINNAYAKENNAIGSKGVWNSSSLKSGVMNGLSGLYFNGYNALSVAETANTYSAGITFFVVFMPTGTDTMRTLVAKTTSSIPSPFDVYTNARFVGNGKNYSAFSSAVDLNSIVSNKVCIFSYRLSVSGTNAYATEWLNGDIQYSNLLLTYYGDTGTSFQIGTRGDTASAFTGYMGEIIVYKSALNDTQVLDVHKYLSQKWSVTVITSYPNTIYANVATIARADNKAEYVHVAEIQIFDKNGNLYTPTSGGMLDYISTNPVTNAFDGNPNTIAHTNTASASGYIQLFLGQTNYDIGKVVVVNRQDSYGLSRIIGCIFKLWLYSSPNYYAVYLSPKITTGQYMYEFTFDVRNTLVLTYYSVYGTEIVTAYVDDIVISSEIVTGKNAASSITHTHYIGFTPTSVSISSSTSSPGTIYLVDLLYNGVDLKSKYTNTTSSIQNYVRNGILPQGSTYTFSV